MSQRVNVLFTIGYSGHTIETFIDMLHAQHISVLLDIRMTPISRKKGFSKRALGEALERAGIRYMHVRALGSPAELRHQLHADGNYGAFFKGYGAYLAQQSPCVTQAAELVAEERVCLMCVEQQPHECHRSVVADAIAQSLNMRLSVKHLSLCNEWKPLPTLPQNRARTTITAWSQPVALVDSTVQ